MCVCVCVCVCVSWRKAWQPTPVLSRESHGQRRGVWWATVHRVILSQTQ